MKLSDFDIGTEFLTNTGQHWRCTDVGRRTILAIELEPELDPAWWVGPPYVVPEVPFDEIELARAYRSMEEATRHALDAFDLSAHPGYPQEVIKKMFDASFLDGAQSYPREGLLRIDRVDASGEILHPYAAEEGADGWNILVYLVFPQTFSALPEREFVRLRAATEEDLKRRRDCLKA